MSNKGFSFSKDIPLTLLVPIVLLIGTVAVLFYRVEVLEKNSININIVYERLVRLEVQSEYIIKQLNRLSERG